MIDRDGEGTCPACRAPAEPGSDACPRCGRGEWFTSSNVEGGLVLRPRGDMTRPQPLQRLLDALTFQPGDRLILEMDQVRNVSSEALGRLLALRKRMLAAGGRLTLRRLDPDVLEVFRVTRIDGFFDLEP